MVGMMGVTTLILTITLVRHRWWWQVKIPDLKKTVGGCAAVI